MNPEARPAPPDHRYVETAEQRADRRRRLERLDHCLDLLESAMESDRTVVDERDQPVLAETRLMVQEGMALADAIEVVLLLQEAYMLPVLRPLEPLRRR